MANLTLTIDEDLLRRARIRALEQGESVNSLVRDWLESYAAGNRQRDVTEEIIAVAGRARASSGSAGRVWTRDNVYEERLSQHD
ncbi:hypothetical protein EF847_07685 [Actinobacteria bacterium YIM 96077]|uniref:Ribbon-helix-helix protein CopG domain-containing protein n=1 Tax=Phytoactinopolyspora halophila TaxID=1981511 RepID=A0A329QKS6_9ACTN|nr:DUF6364 family protein [Phytoactinopolyspora halophila]AYY12606.1 hypothetical protein EF847_07685 [Actinobacteria bacterium YIM 96077]RAW12491.1 hypothetical protein DPM12_13905 [Phytoactinopolyspora halophila]